MCACVNDTCLCLHFHLQITVYIHRKWIFFKKGNNTDDIIKIFHKTLRNSLIKYNLFSKFGAGDRILTSVIGNFFYQDLIV